MSDDKKLTRDNYREFMISKWISTGTFKAPSPLEFEIMSRDYRRVFQRFLPSDKNQLILDLGCGFGPAIYSLKRLGYRNVEGLDLLPECCDYVRREFGVTAHCVDIEGFFKGSARKYDVILAFDVIEHFYKHEIVAIMLEIMAALNRNGVFIMRVPHANSPRGLDVRFSGFTHEEVFTPRSADELFKAVGFDGAHCIPAPVSQRNPMSRTLRRVSRPILGRLLYALGLFDLNSIEYLDTANMIAVGIKHDA
ncbi:MAG: class I SAM-dependent methyltransferase [Thaumarchaeota archaeon]|nr:class I SAM-dependent methyltransferase [Nitrososphaerota archaeon]